MNRKVLGGVLALVVAVLAVWLLWFRDKDSADAAADDPAAGRSAAIDVKRAGERPQQAAPRGNAPRWLLDRDREGPLRLEGQVLDPDGKGVGGAEVWLATVPPRSAKAEDDGTFEFDKLVGRTYTLTATAGDLAGGPVTYKLTAESDPVVVRLVEGAAVTVRVLDERGQPIRGAEVTLGDLSRKRAATDGEGVARLRPVRPGYVAVQATASGYAPNTGYATVGSAGAIGQISITLRKGYAVSGRVIDEAGKPIAKARVYASGGAWGDYYGVGEEADDTAEVTTDDKGTFTIPALAPGPHQLSAVDGEHAPGRTSVTIAEAPITGVEIVMQEGGAISGTVVDVGGKPAPYATVRVAGSGAQMWQVAARQATTDEAGTFELRGLSRKKLTARAESDRAASQLVEVDLETQARRKDLRLVLDVTGSISGVVVDDQGAPVAEVQVNAFPDVMSGESLDGIALAGMSSATTDGAGVFTVHGLPDGSYRLWAARQSSGFEWGQRGVTAKTGDTGVRITLAASGALAGKLVLAGASMPPRVAHVQVGYQAPTPIEAGSFTVKELAPGSHAVTFRGPEFATLVKYDIVIEPGRTTDLGEVTVMRGRRLAGKVVDGSGRPVANAKVRVAEMLFDGEGSDSRDESLESIAGVRSATSDADGRFTIVGIPQKATTAVADHASGRSLGTSIPAGSEDPPPVTLTLRGFGSLRGTVTQKGKPLSGVTVGLSSKGGGAQASFTQTDDAGSFHFAKVPEGPSVIQAMRQAMMTMKSTTVTVDVKAGQETQVTVDIPVGQITLTVNVKAQPGHKVDAAQVVLFNGSVAVDNAKQLTENFFQGGMQGTKFWFGEGKPAPAFDELVPGDYSACTIPLTGDLMDPSFQQKTQEHMHLLKAYCKPVKVPASPTQQAITHAVPSMEPLPAN
jgi:uncharacterized GH25 family protein